MTQRAAESRDEAEGIGALLVTYGALKDANGRRSLTASEVLEGLLSRGYWLARRRPRSWTVGERVVFYATGAGFTATAVLADVQSASEPDWALPEPSLVSHFPVKLVLIEQRIFSSPAQLQPLVESLRFVTNKQNWGSALRPTPRTIPAADAERISAALKLANK